MRVQIIKGGIASGKTTQLRRFAEDAVRLGPVLDLPSFTTPRGLAVLLKDHPGFCTVVIDDCRKDVVAYLRESTHPGQAVVVMAGGV